MICSMLAFRIASLELTICPPVMCPVSCAITPISWFGVSAFRISPVLMKIAWPPATKEFS